MRQSKAVYRMGGNIARRRGDFILLSEDVRWIGIGRSDPRIAPSLFLAMGEYILMMAWLGGGYIMGGGMIYGGMDLRRERPMEPTDAFFCLSGSSRRMDRCY